MLVLCDLLVPFSLVPFSLVPFCLVCTCSFLKLKLLVSTGTVSVVDPDP